MAPFNHHSTDGLFIPTANPCNDYLVQFLIHSKIIMDKQAIRLQYTYQLAVQSVRKYPLPLVCREQLKLLQGFGRFLINQVEQVLKRHWRRGRLETEEQMKAELDWHVRNVTQHAKQLEKRIYIKRVTEKKFKKYKKLEQKNKKKEEKNDEKQNSKMSKSKGKKKFADQDGEQSQSSLNISNDENEQQNEQQSQESLLFSDEEGQNTKKSKNSSGLKFTQTFENQAKSEPVAKKQKKSCFDDQSSDSLPPLNQAQLELYNVENQLEVELGRTRGKGKPLKTPMYNTEPYQVLKSVYLIGGPEMNIVSKFKINQTLFDTINTRIANWKVLKIRLLEAGYIMFPRINDMYNISLTEKGKQLIEVTDQVLRKYGILKGDDELVNNKGSPLDAIIQDEVAKKLREKQLEEQYQKQLPDTAQNQHVRLIINTNQRFISKDDQKMVKNQMKNMLISNVRMIKKAPNKRGGKDSQSKQSESKNNSIYEQQESQSKKSGSKIKLTQNEQVVVMEDQGSRLKSMKNNNTTLNNTATRNKNSRNGKKQNQESKSVSTTKKRGKKAENQIPEPEQLEKGEGDKIDEDKIGEDKIDEDKIDEDKIGEDKIDEDKIGEDKNQGIVQNKVVTRSRKSKQVGQKGKKTNNQKSNMQMDQQFPQPQNQKEELPSVEEPQSFSKNQQIQSESQSLYAPPEVKIPIDNKQLEVGAFMWSVSGMLIDCMVIRFRARDFDLNEWSLVIQQAKATRCTRLFIWVHMQGLEKMSEKRKRRLMRFLIYVRMETSIKIKVVQTRVNQDAKIAQFLRLMTVKIEEQVAQHLAEKKWAEKVGKIQAGIISKAKSEGKQEQFSQFCRQKIEDIGNPLSQKIQSMQAEEKKSQQKPYTKILNGLGTISQFNQRFTLKNPHSLKKITEKIWSMFQHFGCDGRQMTQKMNSLAFIFGKLKQLGSTEERADFLRWLFRRSSLKRGVAMMIIDILMLNSYEPEPESQQSAEMISESKPDPSISESAKVDESMIAFDSSIMTEK